MEIKKIKCAEQVLPESTETSMEQLQHEYDFNMAQRMLFALKKGGIISEVEFNKITALNIQKFSPILGGIIL